MAQYTDVNALVGVVKETYAKKLKDARVNFTILQDMFKLDESSPIGNYFHIPVLLTQSQSTMYELSGSSPGTLPTPIAPVSKDAQVPAIEYSERMQIPFGSAVKFDAGGQVSFISTQTLKMLALNKAIKRQIEWGLLYGCGSTSNLSTQGCVAKLSVGSSATSVTYTMTAGSYAYGYLVGAENQPFDVYDPTLVTKRNSTGALSCSAVDVETGTIALGGAAADNAAVQAGDYLVRRGAVGNDMVGLAGQVANTGTLFNIDASAYSLWKGSTTSSVGNISVAKVLKMVAKTRNRGADGDMLFLGSADCYAALLNDLGAARRTDYSYSKNKLETGAESVTLYSSNGGIEIVEHPFVKNGDCFLLPKDEVMRPGLTDITDNLGGQDLAVMSATTNTWDFRVFTAQASFLAAPAHAVQGTGLTYP